MRLLFEKLSSKMHGRGSRTPPALFWAPLEPRGQGRRCPIHSNSYWEGPIILWFYQLPFSLIDHISRREWGQGPSGYGFGVQKGGLCPINQGCPATFAFITFSPKHTAEPPNAPQTTFGDLYLQGYVVETPKNLPLRGPLLCKNSLQSIQWFWFP